MRPGVRVRVLPSAFNLPPDVPAPDWSGAVLRVDDGWALVRLNQPGERDQRRPPVLPEMWLHTDGLEASP